MAALIAFARHQQQAAHRRMLIVERGSAAIMCLNYALRSI